MSNTDLAAPNQISNLKNFINTKRFVNQREINNLIGAMLHDISLELTSNYSIKTQSRRAEDESFSLQEFANVAEWELLITYFPADFDFKINWCSAHEFEVFFTFYYRIEAKENNKSRLEEVIGLVEQFICFNAQADQWMYIYNEKEFKTWLYYCNQMTSQQLIYDNIQTKNYYFAEQNYKLKFAFRSLNN